MTHAIGSVLAESGGLLIWLQTLHIHVPVCKRMRLNADALVMSLGQERLWFCQ
jgi:hypothetical protein